MKKAKERDEKEKKPPKVELYTSLAVLFMLFMLMPCKPQRSGDPSSKLIHFHIMKNLTDSQPIIVRREHGIADSFPGI